MNLDDIKDKALEKLQNLFARVQETEVWANGAEKFETLAPREQKLALAMGAAVFVGILLIIPYWMLSDSSDSVAQFEEKRNLIRELFRTKRDSAILENSVPAIAPSELQSSAQTQVSAAQLQADQVRSVGEYNNQGPEASPIIPKGVIQKGASVSLAKLSLKQVVDLGHKLQTVHPSAKLIGLDITANRDNPHYFDVVYKLVSFTVPVEPAPKSKASKLGAKKSVSKPPSED